MDINTSTRVKPEDNLVTVMKNTPWKLLTSVRGGKEVLVWFKTQRPKNHLPVIVLRKSAVFKGRGG
jgi:hypothetical protein